MKLLPPPIFSDWIAGESSAAAVALPPQLLIDALRMRGSMPVALLAVARVNAQGNLATWGLVCTLIDKSAPTTMVALEKLVAGGFLELEKFRRSEYVPKLSDGYKIASRYGLAYEVRERRDSIGSALRRQIAERDGHACRYCGGTDRLSLDHVHPWSRGGTDTEDNLVLACWGCNNRKRARTLEEAGMHLRPLGSVN